ncbi:hypothetical protein FACS1894142_1070 [Spirochaetia bacterium]|nr:hypothetical protein FACS1894142_1070 [Spirochaetia bacterium]
MGNRFCARRSSLCAVIFAFALMASPVFADTEITAATNMSLTVSSLPEAKLTLTQDFIFPLLQGSGPLTSGNNLKTTLSGEVSPVSLNGALEATLTPIAFLQAIAGGKLGSGWNVSGLADGLGLNVPSGVYGNRTGKIEGEPLDGLVWKAYGAGLFQFDLAAIFPGDWNHVVFQTRQELNYRAYTRAEPEQSWIFEADGGENRNGLNYYSSYVLGYQMPASPVFNMVGLMAEMDKSLYDAPDNRHDFGDDLGRWTFSSLFNFQVTERIGTTFIIQLHTVRNFTNYPGLPQNGVEAKQETRYYQDRILYNDAPRGLEFYRFAAIVSVRLH